LGSDFPPLASIDMYPSNLPLQFSLFVGRERALAEVAERLLSSRLVTVTGVGGVGKTRLALQVAAEVLPRFPDGAWLCELGAAEDGEALLAVVANVLLVRRRPAVSLEEAIQETLRRRRLLLVLDNCEHLLDDVAGFVDGVLGECPQVAMLATSREGLGVRGEQIWALHSLEVPSLGATGEELAAAESVRLFVSRARDVRSPFELTDHNATAVAEICRRLDGIPLAIELAAARVVGMRPAEIAGRLDERFRLLAGSRRRTVGRQQTLRATVDWSYSLLDATERALFNRLGVFSGSFTGEAATAVAAADGLEPWDVIDGLASLVAKSMLDDDEAPDGTTRYRMLETLREYAVERLTETNDIDSWRRRHATHYADWAERVGPELDGPHELEWQERIALDYDNLRAAIGWALDRDEQTDADLGLRIVIPLGYFESTGTSMWEWALRAAARAEDAIPPRRTAVLGQAAVFSILALGDAGTARRLAHDALKGGVPVDCAQISEAFLALGMCELVEGRPREALRWATDGQRALEKLDLTPAQLTRERQILHTFTASAAALAGEWTVARAEADTAAQLAGSLGPSSRATSLFEKGLAYEREEPDTALHALEECLALMERGTRSANNYGYALAAVARIQSRAGHTARAFRALIGAISHFQKIGLRPELQAVLNEAIVLLVRANHDPQAARIAGVLARPFAQLGAYIHTQRWERALATAHERLGDQRYTEAFEAGAATNVDTALEEIKGLLADAAEQHH
jgi:predicted ATPase